MSLNTILATTPLTSTNYVLKATGTTIGNSLIFDNGTNVGIGNTNTSYTLDVSGSTRTSAVQPSLLINYTDATSYANLIFTESGVNKGIIQFIGSTFATTSRRNNLEIVNGANADMTFWTNNTTRMTITSAGYINIANNTAQLLPITAGNFQILGGAYYNGSNIIAASTDGQRILFSGGGFIFNTFTGATIGNSVTDTERMRITSGGNVGIGISSPARVLDVFGSNGSTTSQIKVKSTGNTSAGYFGIFANSLYISAGGTYDSGWSIDGTNGIANIVMETSNGGSAIAFGTANSNTTATERMRITSGGDVCVNITSPSYTDTGRGTITIGGATSKSAILGMNIGGVPRSYFYSNNTDTYIDNASGTGDVVILNGTGGVKLTRNATSFVSNSDERLKNINSTIENAVDKLLTLRTVNFSWKSDETNTENLGLIAQDIETVFPQIVSKSKLALKIDEEQTDQTEYLGVRYTELIPVLVKAIQELKAQNDDLQSQINELKAQ